MTRTLDHCKDCAAPRDSTFSGNHCRDCYNRYQREWRKAHPEYKQYFRERQQSLRQVLRDEYHNQKRKAFQRRLKAVRT